MGRLLKPASQFKLPLDTLLKLLKQLNLLSKSWEIWFQKYNHLLEKGAKIGNTDEYLSFHYKWDNKVNIKGTMEVYGDDNIASGDS